MPRERKSTQRAATTTGPRIVRVKVPAPLPHQQPILDSPSRFKQVVAGRRFGKALALDTPLPTTDGWTTMGQVREGDVLFDEAGAPTRVTFATEVMHGHECYEVAFSTGERIVADAEHLWAVWTKRAEPRQAAPKSEQAATWLEARLGDGPAPMRQIVADAARAGIAETTVRKAASAIDIRRVALHREGRPVRGRALEWCWRLPRRDEPAETRWGLSGAPRAVRERGGRLPAQFLRPTERTVTTAELAGILEDASTKTGQPFIRTAQPLQCPSCDLPLDPYLLGLWLGDGDSGSMTITTADDEIVESFRACVGAIGLPARETQDPRSRARRVRAVSAQTGHERGAPRLALESAGVYRNKHIPAAYLRASVGQRLALLQGLMDTDGTVSKAGVCAFDTTSAALADGVRELIVGLGMKPDAIYKKRAMLDGVDCGVAYRVSFLADMPVFRLRRKLERQSIGRGDLRHRIRIVSVRRVPSVPVRCITVDSASHLYLAGRDCVPTHNTLTSLIACVEGHGGDGRPLRGAVNGAEIWWVAPTFGQAAWIWRELKYALAGAWVDKSEMEHRILLPGGGAITVKSSDNPDLLRGAGLDGVVIDEAASCVPETWYEAIRPALADRRGWAMLIGTPKGQNWFWELWEKAASEPDWERWQAPTAHNPLVTPDEIEANRRALPPQTFLQEFEAQFVREGGSVFHSAWFRRYREDVSRGERVLRDDEGERRVSVAAGNCFVTVDLAVSVKTQADYTVFGCWQQTPDGDLLLLDLLRDRMEGPAQLPALQRFCARYPVSSIAIESVAYQSAFVQESVRAGLPALGYKPDRDKMSRANLAASRYRQAKVWHPESAPWLAAVEGELLAFPEGAHDDVVDCVSLACLQASQSWTGLSQYYQRLKAKRQGATA